VTSKNNIRAAAALRDQALRIAGPVAAAIEDVAVSDMNSLGQGRRIRLLIALTSLQGVCRELVAVADYIDPQEVRR
jgi:hypothetical protein